MTRKLEGSKRYPDAGTAGGGSLIVNEIYPAIDGEGPWQGCPVVIVRLMGCNLRCSYCDSSYAYFEGEKRPLSEVVGRVREAGIGKVLVTGGEPLAQGATPAFIGELLASGFEVSVETNGSYPVSSVPKEAVMIVDVKTPDSGEAGSFLEENLDLLTGKDCLKFVIGSVPDYEWARDFVRSRPGLGCDVLFTPAYGKTDPRELAELLLEDRLRARFSIQLHKALWGEARGV